MLGKFQYGGRQWACRRRRVLLNETPGRENVCQPSIDVSLSKSMFPPETMQTTLPVPALPEMAQATGVAPAP